ncbi:MAG: cobC1 [Chloroflexi bacterium]|nr:cobC1 [Chloroflexota bacterium]
MNNSQDQNVVFVRHGETEWSKSGKHTSITDVPLTDEGRRMSSLVGRALAGRHFTKVLSSPLSRALETCSIAGYGAQAEIRDDLLEMNYGIYEGLTTAEIRTSRPDWSVWTGPTPNGETPEQVGRRCDRVIAEVRSADGDVLIFAHGHNLRILGARWVDLPADGGRLLALATASISTVGYEREQPVLSLWNSEAHLHGGPLPA